MVLQSRLTSQGQISVPARVRQKLGLGPGSVMEWQEKDGAFLVKRAAKFSSSDIHAVVFPGQNPALIETKAAIRRALRKRHARD